ncbi:MAG: ankyrin repeat domain-containing protein, partial [Nitrososphaerota archaeon]|nr:ankyrin repeat domain-containing protein [Nitrososphaerota archaeon]
MNIFGSSHKKEEKLLRAVEIGDITLVRELVASGTDINYKGKNGSSAVLFAVCGGYVDCVKYLIEAGADVNSSAKYGITPLYMAANSSCSERGQIVKMLIKAGADLNHKMDLLDHSALHAAASNGYVDCLKYLIEGGANVNLSNTEGVTPLHLAAERGYAEIADMLVKAGANVNAVNNNKDTPYTLATRKGFNQIMDILTTVDVVGSPNVSVKNGLSLESFNFSVFEYSGSEYIGANQEWVRKINQESSNAITWFNAQKFVPIPTWGGLQVEAQYCYDMAIQAQNTGNVQEAWAGFHQALQRYCRLYYSSSSKMVGLSCFNLGKVYGVNKNWEL